MEERQCTSIIDGLTEELASIEHERWSHWQRYMHGKGKRQQDGSLTLPANLVAQWERQMATEYVDLNDEEKESDREQVRRVSSFHCRCFSRRAVRSLIVFFAQPLKKM